MVLSVSPIFAQIKVSGTVTDESGTPIPFASVVVKGTTNGVAADADGNYTISATGRNDVLVFSSIGYRNQEIAIAGKGVVNAFLASDNESLNEVMVVAYGTAKKSSFTGAASTVGKEQFDLRPVTGVTSALAGTTAGVQVSAAGGMPGDAPSIRIRGIGSFNAGNGPLTVLDGMPYDGDISAINPNDIESMTVLKDASSAALYGSRAANGVLIITTKKGRADKLQVSASYNIGLTNRQTADYETLDTNEYMQMYWEATRNADIFSGYDITTASAIAGEKLLTGLGYNAFNTTADKLFDPTSGAILPGNGVVWADDLNWRDYVERTGIRHDANISMSGGTKKSDYYASFGYTNDQGYWVGSSLERYSINTSINSQITKWLKIGANVNASVKTREGQQSEASGNNSNPFRFIRYIGNIFPVHVHYPNGDYLLRDGEKVFDFGIGYELPDGTITPKRDYMQQYNHAAEVPNRYNGYRRLSLNAKAYAEITFLKHFKFAANVGLGEVGNYSHSADVVYVEKNNNGSATRSAYDQTSWTINQILSYDQNFGKHHVDVMVGHESYDYKYSYQTASKKTQIVIGNNYELANYAEADGIPDSYTSTYRLESLFSRANYDYDDKYFVSASFRRDGSSRFYEGRKWGNFWSAGLGWRIDKEGFMSNVDWIDLLKVRASYGEVGNDDVGYYPWMAAFAKDDDSTIPSYFQSTLGATDLTWETSGNLSAAVEWNMFKGRFNGTLEFFNRQSSNLLFSVPLPLSAGIDDKDMNAGTMYNRGFELTFDVDAIRTRNFTWNINGNVTYLKNKITYLPVDPYNSSPHRIEEGHPIYEFYLRQWEGVNPANGYCVYEADLDNPDIEWGADELYEFNGKMCTEDIEHAKRDWSGNSMPPFIGGFGMNFKLYRFTLSFNSYFQLGGKFYDSTYATLMTCENNTTSNPFYHKLHVDLLNRWQQAGDVTNTPRVTTNTDTKNTGAASSTRWLTSSNMFELTNITLAYDLSPKACSTIGIKGLKVYCSADNTLMFASRVGMFPRTHTYSGSDGNSNVYQPARTVSFGLKLNF